MLSVKNYFRVEAQFQVLVQDCVCLHNLIERLAVEDANSTKERLTISDVRDICDHITATLGKINSICTAGRQVDGDSVQADK